ncbi:MAG: TRAP transporter large permease subunit [Pseudomonadales bacterium]
MASQSLTTLRRKTVFSNFYAKHFLCGYLCHQGKIRFIIPILLFILYWGMLSFITPPVALGAFAAASIAGASALSTGFKAMRLGSVIYFIPFFFVLEPALILSGS